MAFTPPQSVVIIGSGVFGLGTADALARRPAFAHTTITVVDRGTNDPSITDDNDDRHFPARDAASIDSSRIIRHDYADPAYAALAYEAQLLWRGDNKTTSSDHIGGQGRYTESGLVLVADRGAAPAAAAAAGKSSMDYVRESFANAQAIAQHDPYLAARLKELPTPEAIRAAVGTGGSSGDWGYLNAACGWANAEASMAWMLARVRRTGRVRFVRGRVAGLERQQQQPGGVVVTGVRLADGRVLTADLVIAAAGAWTEALLGSSDDAGVAGALSATGQCVGFVPFVDASERQALARMPVLLNLSSGLFVIPPGPDSREIKVARHGYGYLNPVTAGVSSTPHTQQDDPQLAIPAEGAADLRRGLRQMLGSPLPALVERPFSRTRLCWYTDTPTADFVIDYHPRCKGLFVATGGSGHGFKFLPVIGDKIVDCIEGHPPEAFRHKWAWKSYAPGSAVTTADGSRGGPHGLILQQELTKTPSRL